MDWLRRVVTKYLELIIIIVIALIVLLVPGYRERFPAVITSPNGICFILALVGLIQCRVLRKTKRAKATMPLAVLSFVLAIVGVYLL